VLEPLIRAGVEAGQAAALGAEEELVAPPRDVTADALLTARGVVTPQVSQITLSHGSYVARFIRDTPPAQLLWPPQSGRDAKLIARVGKRDLLVGEATGDWALFRLVSRATRADANGSSVRAEWTTQQTSGVPVAVEFVVRGGYPVLQRGALGGMTCVAQVTR